MVKKSLLWRKWWYYIAKQSLWSASVLSRGCKCNDGFFLLISSMFISRSGNMNKYADSSYLCFCVSCVKVIVEDAVRTVKVRRRSHRKCASIKSPRNFLKKKAANDLLQWPTSPKWHIFAHLLDCSIVPPCADWGSAAIGLSPREAETWNSLAHALTEFRIASASWWTISEASAGGGANNSIAY